MTEKYSAEFHLIKYCLKITLNYCHFSIAPFKNILCQANNIIQIVEHKLLESTSEW